MGGNNTKDRIRAIGIRAAPSSVHYAIVDRVAHDAFEIVDRSAIVIPAALQPPAQLSFVRTTFLDIMEEYTIRLAGIRLAEYNAKQVSWFRLSLEGVIQELLHSSPVEEYFAGPIATIASRLGQTTRQQVKAYFDGEPFMDLDGWNAMSVDARESVVTAVAAATKHK